MNNYVVIQIVKEKDDKIEQCKVLGVFSSETEAKRLYERYHTLVCHPLIIVPNISMQDIPLLSISQYKSI